MQRGGRLPPSPGSGCNNSHAADSCNRIAIMNSYTIEGGQPLSGVIRASGNKNAALPCIAAALLTDAPVILSNLPQIEDVQIMLTILRKLGVEVQPLDNSKRWRITARDITEYRIPYEEATCIRASILCAGPMLARLGRVALPPPGGDVIGRRRLDTHFLAMQSLGARIKIEECFELSARHLTGAMLFLDEASVTATENAIMAAVLARGETIIENAASEPHIQDLCHMLKAMGAHIEGVGSNILCIQGVAHLHGTEFAVGADYMEVGSFIGLAAATGSEIVIQGVEPRHLRMTRIAFAKLGITWETQADDACASLRSRSAGLCLT